MITPEELSETIRRYYITSDSAYRNWGPDPERNGVFAIHLGFHASGEAMDNHTAVKQMTRKVVETADIHPGQKILDAGCGAGSIAFEIAVNNPDCCVEAINIAENQLATAEHYRRIAEIPNLHFSMQDYLITAFREKQFDRVIFCESLAHSADKYYLMKEAHRVLKPTGKVVIADCFMSGEEYTVEELMYLHCFKTGMGVPSMIEFEKFNGWLKEIGFEKIKADDITRNVLPSALLGSRHAEGRIRQQTNVPDETTQGRFAMIGIERLMSVGKARYYLLTAQAVK